MTCWQRVADWFVLRMFYVTGTTGGAIANNDAGARALLQPNPAHVEPLTSEKVASLLRKGWVFNRGLKTPDMQSGTLNEGAVFKNIAAEPFCAGIFECGLLQSKEFPCLAVSPDGVATVFPPGQVPGQARPRCSPRSRSRPGSPRG